jgi:hypothetical protein
MESISQYFPDVFFAVFFSFVSFCLIRRLLVSYIRSGRHQTACFKAPAKSYNVATRTADPRRAKTDLNSQRSKARNTVLMMGMKSFRDLEARNLVTDTIVEISHKITTEKQAYY